jgi:hypothetical protein
MFLSDVFSFSIRSVILSDVLIDHHAGDLASTCSVLEISIYLSIYSSVSMYLSIFHSINDVFHFA